MIQTYKCRCCKNCQWSYMRDDGRTRACSYYGNDVRDVDDDEICAGWEPNGAVSETQFMKTHEDDVVKTYDISMAVTVKGKESQMRYADAVKADLAEWLQDSMEGADTNGDRMILQASVVSCKVHDTEDRP